MPDVGKITGQIDLEDAFSAKLNAASAKISGVGDKFNSIGKSLLPITVAIAGVAVGLAALGARGAAVDDVSTAFDRLTGRVGETSEAMLTALRRGVKGTLSDFDLMKEANKALSTGFKGTADDFEVVASGARILGKQIGVDTATAFQKMTKAMASGRVMSLKNLGLFIDQKQALEAYATSIGKVAGDLTDAERATALQNAAMDALRDTIAQSGTPAADFGEVMDRITVKFKNFIDRIAVAVSQSPAMWAALNAIEDAADSLIKMLIPLGAWIGKLAEWFADLSPIVQKVILAVGAFVAALGPMLIAFGTALKIFAAMLPALKLVGAAFALLASPIGLVVVAIVGLTIVWVKWQDEIKAFFTLVLPAIVNLGIAAILKFVSESVKNLATFVSVMALLPGETGAAFTKASDSLRNFARDVDTAAEKAEKKATAALVELNTSADKAEVSVDELAESTENVTKRFDEAGDSAAFVTEEVIRLAEKIGRKGLKTEADELNDALAQMNRTGDTLSREGLNSVLKMIEELLSEGVKLPPLLEDIRIKTREFGRQALESLSREKLIAPVIDWEEALKSAGETLDATAMKLPPLADDIELVGGMGETKTRDWNEVTRDANDLLSKTSGLLNLVGVEGDSAFGKVLTKARELFDMFNSLIGSISDIIGLVKGFGGGGGGLFGGLAGLFGGGGGAPTGIGLGIGTGPFETAGTTAATGFLGGFGSAVSGGLSTMASTLAPLFTNPFTAAIGAAVVGFFALKGLFGGPSRAESLQTELSRDFGIMASEAFSEGLDQATEGIKDRSTALILSLGEIFREGIETGSANFDILAERAGDVFSFLERGQISAAQAQQVLNDSVADLTSGVSEMGAEGVFQLERILSAAEASGIGFKDMDKLAEAYVKRANELGISVNNVTLEALGLEGALELLGKTGEESFEKQQEAVDKAEESVQKLEEGVFDVADAVENELAKEVSKASDIIERDLKIAEQKAKDLEAKFRDVARAARDIDIPGGGGPDAQAQGGFFSRSLPADMTIGAHRGEGVFIHPEGFGGGAPMFALTIQPRIQIGTRVLRGETIKTVQRGERVGDLTRVSESTPTSIS